jgi:hypothetical protein
MVESATRAESLVVASDIRLEALPHFAERLRTYSQAREKGTKHQFEAHQDFKTSWCFSGCRCSTGDS